MHDKKQIIMLALIMTISALATGGTAIALLYQAAFNEQKVNLINNAKSQARLIEAVARFDKVHSQTDHPEGATAATISQIKDAHQQQPKFGKTGEYLIGKKEGNQIVFLFNHGTINNKVIKPVIWDSVADLPMQQALKGLSGSMRGTDYKGNHVLAAYEPVAILNLGIVVKIDIAEIREPFINASVIAIGLTLIIITIATINIFKISNPMLDQIKKQNQSLIKNQKRLAEAQEIAHTGHWEWNITTSHLAWSDEIYRIFGCEPQQFDATYDAFISFIHPDDRNSVNMAITQSIEHNTPYAIEHRIIQTDGIERIVFEKGKVLQNEQGAANRMIGTVQDITEQKQIENKLKNSEEQIHSLLMSTGEAIYGIDLQGNCTFANASCLKVLGCSSTSELLGKNMHKLIHHSHADGLPYDQHKCHIYEAFKKAKSIRISDEVFWRLDGTPFPVEYCSEPIFKDGTVNGAVISFSDITQRKEIEEQLLLSDRVFKNTSEAIIITEPNGNIIDTNQAFTYITGYSKAEVIGKNPRIMKSGKQNNAFYENMWKTLLDHGKWTGDLWDRKKNGDEYPKSLTINAIKNTNNVVTHYIGIFSDITESKMVAKQLQKLAFYDSLTNLPNRILFKERLAHEIKAAKRRNTKFAVMFMDLDRFKYINDTLGHTCGDQLLIEAAKRIKTCIRETDTVARFGGDEFIIILTDIDAISVVKRIANKIISTLSEKFIIEKNDVNIGVSIGISIYPNNGATYDALTKNADTAMYKVKETGRNSSHFFTEELHATIKRRLIIEKEMRAGIKEKAFELHYQPKVEIDSSKIIGMEALLRWKHPKLGTISPVEFIPIAEETGLIIPLGNWALRQACAQNAAWIKAGHTPLRVAVNLSIRQFEQQDITDQIQNILIETGLPAKHLELEITESMVMGDINRAILTLKHLRELGVHISVDDFGTGYSSLSYLKQFPIQCLKIDKSFVDDLCHNTDAAAIISAIISMAGSLDLTVVAEGVETKEQMEFLRKDGCDQMQGYYYSKPLPTEEFTALLYKKTHSCNIIPFESNVKEKLL
ncbi:EAL domain-containing protein [Pseudomonadota bacterium]